MYIHTHTHTHTDLEREKKKYVRLTLPTLSLLLRSCFSVLPLCTAIYSRAFPPASTCLRLVCDLCDSSCKQAAGNPKIERTAFAPNSCGSQPSKQADNREEVVSNKSQQRGESLGVIKALTRPASACTGLSPRVHAAIPWHTYGNASL